MAEQAKKSKMKPRPTGYSQPFWDGAKQGKFLIQRDPESGKCQFYPRPVSVWGSRRTPEWIESKGMGTIISFTRTIMAADGFEDEVPYTLAVAKLDEGPRIFAQMVKDTAPPNFCDRVKIVWEDTSADFPVFKFQLVK
jgi:uncharacterized OB-fold protein